MKSLNVLIICFLAIVASIFASLCVQSYGYQQVLTPGQTTIGQVVIAVIALGCLWGIKKCYSNIKAQLPK